jgi:hypothetical protein
VEGHLEAAKDSVRARLDERDLRHFVDSAEVFQTTKAGDLATTDALKAQAKDEYADRVVGRPGRRAGQRRGEADLQPTTCRPRRPAWCPTGRGWPTTCPSTSGPEKVIGQLWGPYNPAHEPGTFPVPATRR